MPAGSEIGKFLAGVKAEAKQALLAGLKNAALQAKKQAAQKATAAGAKAAKSGVRFAKAIPVIGTFVTAVFWLKDMGDRGVIGGTANSGMDMIPLFGTAKIVSEWYTGVDIIECKDPNE